MTKNIEQSHPLIEWLKDVLDGQHLSDCGKPNHSLGPLWINVLDIALLFREITCGSNLWRVLCSCISVFLTNIFFSVIGKWPLVYAYMNLQTCIGIISTHLCVPSCLNKHEVSAFIKFNIYEFICANYNQTYTSYAYQCNFNRQYSSKVK